ncbi:DUF1549 domain-containing protein [Bythopirellula polymerisocia]|uniref:DUF1549 domain-containing protein n=1 Tax=Bythopirellula polymerisocia TaxID=2528003 RepID=A0A5C6CXA3_9BACT|nr:DUF1549 domain-containing protein [Bythopirellula polymerisocia]TWU27259.1 hypothetical protein Pla144_20310 [Bythopirellula polymerisocia]
MASHKATSVLIRRLFLAAPILVFILLDLRAHSAEVPMMEMGSAEMQDTDGMGGAASPEIGANSTSSQSSANRRLSPTQVDPDLAREVAASAAEIDRMVLEKLKAEKVRPNPKSNDMQFVRRIYLDITGTIPTAQQASAFLNKPRSGNKRAELIDELLNSTGYVSHSFNYWADILRLKDQPNGRVFSQPYNEWIKDTLANDMPYDAFVHQLLAAEGRTWENPAVGYVLRDAGMPLSNLDNTIRIFLGTRIGCAQCHDHPFDKWTQLEFYHLAAFVNAVDTNAARRQVNPVVMNAVAEIQEIAKKDEKKRNLPGRINGVIGFNRTAVAENRNRPLRLPHDYQYDDAKPGDIIEPKVLFGQQPQLTKKGSKRSAFAEWLTSPDNPRFTLTIVNRLWKRALGVGLIEPVDDLTDETEATNQPLLDHLIAEMKRLNYSQRELLRIIYNTETYQRQATTRDLAAEESYYFPGPILRRMTAEQIWDSLLTLTMDDPNAYQRPRSDALIAAVKIESDQPVSSEFLLNKATQLDKVRREGPEQKLNKKFTHQGSLMARASELPLPLPPSHFLRQFGQSDRELIQGGSTEGHVPQILTMFNGPISHKLLNEGTVIYDEVVASPVLRDQIDVIFLSIVGRKPTRTDYKTALTEIQMNGPAGYGNVIWALLNTREFLFIQ